ncbi:xanthine/CO dehydrogenase XdhC/CoxF family maturation factor [Granulicella aggregans]|uniref:Xanthine/CO dehydrogenase XdhC/CoxF family maturation factor n=1 Tax=Granulicella aggregans TaxID=474949 RepID=A0A7W8E278_9BACT|nr:XdhC/CoxI family protein [Granulicella aggregans]MBB5056613.1 xanthine/CO dehydrogenase XdhC/CoxF family maturation factor [Granulicella aggregans]
MERRQIVGMAAQGQTGPMVTLVRIEGSSYRQAGARLLLSSNTPGTYAGTISGGCLETEVVTKALWKVRSGPVVERYSTLFDDTAEVPYGLGCGGTVDLLFEPAGTPEFEALLRALAEALQGESFTILTRLPSTGVSFARAVLSATKEVLFASDGLSLNEIEQSLEAEQPELLGVFREQLTPPQRLLVFGAGDDAKPLVNLAALLGWTVLVADGRSQLAKPERFPAAAQVFAVTTADLDSLSVSSSDAVVLMTHSYEQDREWLAALLPVAPRYFGVLGARHRSSLLVSEAAVLCGLPLATCCERIFAPVGLDLGGDGPEAIALAVLAEAQARCMGRLGASRRLSADDVAAQVNKGGPSRYLQAQCAVDDSLSRISTDAASLG